MMINKQEYTNKVFQLDEIYKELLSIGYISSFVIIILLKIPLLNYLLCRNIKFLCFAIGALHKKKNYFILHRLFAKYLKANHYFNKPDAWWLLMRLAVAISQERQINQFIIDVEWENKLILLAENGPEPKVGCNPAYSFVGQSLWLFERGNVSQAINKVELAILAEPNWAYPQYLMGWYGLFTVGVDSVTYFSKAVAIDWSFLKKIKKDRSCQQYPDIIKKVHQRVLVTSKYSSEAGLK